MARTDGDLDQQTPADALLDEVRALVREQREACLWFLDVGYVPTTREEALCALRWLERHGDRDTYVRARELRQWLSPTSSEASAAS